MDTVILTAKIKSDVCDSCGRRGPTALTTQNGADIFGICQACDSDTFESVARTQIDSWLAGNDRAFN
jgi:hypothetical protein